MPVDVIPPTVVVVGIVFIGLGSIVTVVDKVLAIWSKTKPSLPCQVGEQRYNELKHLVEKCTADHEAKYKDVDNRLQRGTRAMKHIEDKIEAGLQQMASKSEESDRRINQRLNQMSELISKVSGVVDMLKEDRKK